MGGRGMTGAGGGDMPTARRRERSETYLGAPRGKKGAPPEMQTLTISFRVPVDIDPRYMDACIQGIANNFTKALGTPGAAFRIKLEKDNE